MWHAQKRRITPQRENGQKWTVLALVSVPIILLQVPVTSATLAPPTLGSVTPSVHHTTGGTSMTLIGSNFGAEYLEVRVDSALASAIVYHSTTKVTAVAPEGVGSGLSVNVIYANQTNPSNKYFSYALPTVNTATPNTGDMVGGYTVTMDGSNFGVANQTYSYATESGRSTSVLTASIQGRACSESVWLSNTRVLCTAVANSGAGVNVAVTTDGQTNVANTLFTHPAPSVTGISITEGPTYGGEVAIITGTNFGYYDSSPTASVGTNPCQSTSYISDTMVSCVIPKVYSAQSGSVYVTITAQVTTETSFVYNLIANDTEYFDASSGKTFQLGDDTAWTFPAQGMSRSQDMYLSQIDKDMVTNDNTNSTKILIPSGRIYELETTQNIYDRTWDLDATLSLEAVVGNLSSHYHRIYYADSSDATSWNILEDVGSVSTRTMQNDKTISQFGAYFVGWAATYVSSFSPIQSNPNENVTLYGYGFGVDNSGSQVIYMTETSSGLVVPCQQTFVVNDTEIVCLLPLNGYGKWIFTVSAHGYNYTVPEEFIYRLDGTPIQIIEASISGSNLMLEFVKNHNYCLHLVLSSDVYLTPLHSRNLFCGGQTPIVITAPLTYFNGTVSSGVSVKLVHGNTGVQDQSAAYTIP